MNVEFSATVLGYHPTHGTLIAASAAQEVLKIHAEICEQLRAENEALKLQVEVLRKKANDTLELREDNKALRDYIASLMSTMPKIKADAIRDAMKDCEYRVTGVGHVISHVELSKHADKLEQGEK